MSKPSRRRWLMTTRAVKLGLLLIAVATLAAAEAVWSYALSSAIGAP
jgi:hypothetical protein